MKREDFFEALSDIDENMIAAADEREQPARPVIVTVPKKNKKPLFATAACVLLAAAVTATTAAVLNRTQMNPAPLVSDKTDPAPTVSDRKEYKTVVNVINGSKYPDALYAPVHDFSSINEIKYIGDEYPDYPTPTKFSSYDQLAEYSQLVVMGTFISDGGQVTQESDIPDFSEAMKGNFSNKYLSYNTLKVEKVLKGNGKVWAGDEIIITQPYVVVYHIDDEYKYYSFSQSTPMQKGDKWIYFLNPNTDYPENIWGDQSYSAVNDYEGRYPVPGDENAPFKYRENVNGVVAPAVFNQSIYSELGEKLAAAEQSPRPTYVLAYEKVINPFEPFGYNESDYPTGLNVEFELEEFEGVTFGWEEGALYTRTDGSEERKTTSIGGSGVYAEPWYTYLCDLTGDGRREICTCVSFGSGIVHNFLWVWDYFNDKLYILSDRGVIDYTLDKRDGELYLLSWEFSLDSPYDKIGEIKAEPLTLDMLKELDLNQAVNREEETQAPVETEQPQETEQPSENVFKIMDLKDDTLDDLPITFDMEEFPGASFRYDPTEDPNEDVLHLDWDIPSEDEYHHIANWYKKITAIYLYDLNGDGKREICLATDTEVVDTENNTVETGHNSIHVIDFENKFTYSLSCLYGMNISESIYHYDITLKISDGVLMVERTDNRTGDVISCEPLTLDIKGMYSSSDIVVDAED